VTNAVHTVYPVTVDKNEAGDIYHVALRDSRHHLLRLIRNNAGFWYLSLYGGDENDHHLWIVSVEGKVKLTEETPW